jgi:hypothetical protein
VSPSMGTALSESLVKHRRAFATFVTSNDDDEWQLSVEAKRLYGLFHEWNQAYFHGQLLVPHILLSEPKSPRALGDTARYSGWGSRLQIRLRPSLLTGTYARLRSGEAFKEGRFRYTADVLLHELIHHHNEEILHEPETGWHGHGPKFRDECNRIGAELGLPPVRTSKRRGADQHLPSCAQWPHTVRPAAYYLGALADPEPPEPKVPAACPVCLQVAAHLDQTLARFCLTRGMTAAQRYACVVDSLRQLRALLPASGVTALTRGPRAWRIRFGTA